MTDDTEKAIADFEKFKEMGYGQAYLPSSGNIETALSALRAQLKRENPKTKADRIRAMSDEELAAWICLPDGNYNQYEMCITVETEKHLISHTTNKPTHYTMYYHGSERRLTHET